MFNLLLILILPFIAHAELTEVDRSEFPSKNLLKDLNPGAENGTSKWVATGGTVTIETSSSNIHSGSRSIKWDPSATGQYLASGSGSKKSGMDNSNGVAFCYVKTDATDIDLAVNDTSTERAKVAIPASTNFIPVFVNFIYSNNAPIQIQIKSNSNSNPIYVDDCFIGDAFAINLNTLTQAEFVGKSHFATTATCTWTRTNTAFGVFTATAACPGPTIDFQKIGSWQTTDANLPRQTINNLPPGSYIVRADMNTVAGTASGTNQITINDGTTSSGFSSGTASTASSSGTSVMGYFEYSSAGNRTFEIFGSSVAGTDIILQNNDGNKSLDITIWKFPLSNQTAFNPGVTGPQSWSGYHDSTCSWARTNTAYGDPTADASCALVEVTNRNFGSVTASGGVLPAITFTPSRSGRYLVCASGQSQGGTVAASNAIKLWDGTTTIAEQAWTVPVATYWTPFSICGIYNAATTAVTASIQTKASAGSITLTNNTNRGAIEWSVISIDQSLPTPILANSVVTSSSGVTRVESARLNCDAASSIVSQNGSWVTSIGNIATGSCSITLTSGIFATAPYCTAITETISGGDPLIMGFTTAPTTTTITTDCALDTGVDCTAYDFDLICTGAK